MTLNKEFSNFLGHPKEFDSFDDMINNFIYNHEFIWINYGYNMKFEKLKELLSNKYNDNFFGLEIPLSKTWWLMQLITMKESAILNDYSFCIKTIDYLLNKYESIDETDLGNYCSMIAYCFYREFSAFPLLNPSLNLEYGATILEVMPSFGRLAGMVSDIELVFKEYSSLFEGVELTPLELLSDNYKMELGLVEKEKYLAEFFISFISSVVISYNEQYPEESLSEIYNSMTVRFLDSVVNVLNEDLESKLLAVGEKHLI